jgi:hypothetical protein
LLTQRTVSLPLLQNDYDSSRAATDVLDPSLAAVQFGPHYQRMRAIKGKYDPEGVFGRWVPVRPAHDLGEGEGEGVGGC